MFMDTDIETNIDMDFANLLSEEDVYTSKGTQKTEHKESIIFCKRCFSSFDNQPLKNTLYGQAALDQHQLICGAYKPILPQMPDAGTILEFDGWSKTQRHPIVIYADFEALLVKCKESKGKNTSAFQKHEPMSYGVFIKATENIPLDLLENDEEYEHAVSVWNHFKCKTLGEYSDLYLKIDVLLLADVFENFRDMCISTYNLDPVFYYTAPGFSFDCMLKYTNVKLELLSDYDTHLFIENSIRGGLTQASMRYAKANNEKTIDYDPTKPKSWIVYQDCNNLYGWAMSQYMPYGDFKWVEPKLDGLDALTPTSDIGRVYEVDISYPNELHDSHNDLPFLPENKIPPGSKVKKLMATLHSKKNYVIHYRNLQQAIANGIIVEKVHRVLEFRQSAWLAKYIQLNTEMRKKAVNEFEKDFFKLLNNAVFGFAVLDISKSFDVRISLWYYEESFRRQNQPHVYRYRFIDISYKTDDFYKDLKSNANLLDRMDTSDLPRDHPCYIAERKKIPGLFSDETKGQPIIEFIALRAKSYAYILNNKEKIKAKGVRGKMYPSDHSTIGYEQSNPKNYASNREDDKRIVQTDRIHTYAYGHFKFDC
ncbi:hypothetical protein QTP88_025973 [Uroleucon formosanum]